MSEIDIKAGQDNTVPVGLFYDVDGVTPVTTSISPKMSINGAAQIDPTNDTVHLGGGEHVLTLTAAECVAGRLLSITVPGVVDERLPEQRLFRVRPAAVFDSLYLGTDNLPVDVVQQNNADLTSVYQAKFDFIQLTGFSYTLASWFKDGSPVVVTSPRIQIRTLAGANVLNTGGNGIANMIGVASTNVTYYLDTASAILLDTPYIITFFATIDGVEREWEDIIVTSNQVPTPTSLASALLSTDASTLGILAGLGVDNVADRLIDITTIKNLLNRTALTGTTSANGTTTTAVVDFGSVSIGANDLRNCVLVSESFVQPNVRILSNTAGTTSTITFDATLAGNYGNNVPVTVLGFTGEPPA